MELVAWAMVEGDNGTMRILYSGSKCILRVPEMIGGHEGMMAMSLLRYMWTERESKMVVQALLQI